MPDVKAAISARQSLRTGAADARPGSFGSKATTPQTWIRRLFGVNAAVSIPFVGGLALPLTVLVGVSAFALRRTTAPPRLLTAAAVAAVVSGTAITASSLLHGTEIPRTAVLSFFALSFLMLAAMRLTDGVRSATDLLVWTCVSAIGYYTLVGTAVTRANFANLWKYGIAFDCTLLVLVALNAASRRFRPLLASSVLGLLAVVSLVLAFRSHALVCLVATAVVLAKGRSAARIGVAKLAAAVMALVAVAVVVPAMIDAGTFGQDVHDRTVRQLDERGSVLLGGRAEPPLSLAIIAESPLTGIGNANAIDRAVLMDAGRLATNLGMASSQSYLKVWIREDGSVSLHSIALAAWAEGGVVAFAGPVALVVLFGAALRRARGDLVPIVAVICVGSIWDLFFSPWAPGQPVEFAVAAVLAARVLTANAFRTGGRSTP